MNHNKKVLLVIMDGWGLGQIPVADAIFLAKTPYLDELMQEKPNSTLITYGNEVGLPDGQMGNSEVGHLNIGAGRIVYQDLLKIDNAIEDGSFDENQVLLDAIEYVKTNGKKFHLLGLVSDGGVHSHISHLKYLCNILQNAEVESYIHAFTDGRDTSPTNGLNYIQDLKNSIAGFEDVYIATLCGRFYAMDRDKRWERTKVAYDMMVKGEGTLTPNFVESIQKSYEEGVEDEFIMPLVKMGKDGNALAKIEEGDVVMCFNFRTDRCRQITTVLSQQTMTDLQMHKLKLHYLTMTQYDESFKNVNILFEKDNLKNTLGEILADNEMTQLRAAESEKYPHVSFFFSGGREKPFSGEERILAPSPKVKTYDLQPEMSAYELTEKVVEHLTTKQPNFAVVNYANPDMVGHTGVKEAVVKAVEVTDECVKKLVETATAEGYSSIIIADHGNADFIENNDGSPNTAHTKNPVPIIFVDKNNKSIKLKEGKLADIAPTILSLMNIDRPKEMTGDVLFES